MPQKNTLQKNGSSAAILRYLSMTKFPWNLKYMAKYILKDFFLTSFPSTQKKYPKIYAVTLVLPLKIKNYQLAFRWNCRMLIINLTDLILSVFFYRPENHRNSSWLQKCLNRLDMITLSFFFPVSLYFHIFSSLYISTYNLIDVNVMHARSLCSHAHDFVINFLTVLCTHFSVALKGEK